MLHKIMKNSVLVFITINFTIALYGQTVYVPPLVPSIPTSPQAEAFKRYGEYSINYSTGIPDISIPLYEVDHRGYKLPLALKYYPKPIKPGYNYDVFGLGWGLSISSCISRTIESVPDEWLDFKIKNDIFDDRVDIYKNSNYSCFTDYNLVKDKFHAVLPNGIEFDFVIERIDNNELTYTVSGSHRIKISCSYDKTNIKSFTVIDDSGVTYTFSEGDTPLFNIYNKTFSRFNNSNVSWLLTKIDLPNSPESITFKYDLLINSRYPDTFKDAGVKIFHYKEIVPSSTSPASDVRHTVQSNFVYIDQPDNYKIKLLTSISYGSNKIEFYYQNPDKVNNNYNYVKKIKIIDAASIEVDFVMHTTNVQTHTSFTPHPIAKLDSLIINSAFPSDKPQIYQCKYENIASYFSGIDHWGFSNSESSENKVANLNLFVEFNYNYENGPFHGVTKIDKLPSDLCPYDKIKLLPNGNNTNNREPASPSRHGVISQLKYPTGGYTDFVFENHQFLSSTDYDGSYIHDTKRKRVTTAGGFRIKKITNYESDGKVAEVKNFRYGKTYIEAQNDNINFQYPAYITPNLHTGVGEAVVDPNILTYMNYTSTWYDVSGYFMGALPIRNMILGLDEYGEYTSFYNPFNYTPISTAGELYWECEFSSSNFRKLVNGRPPVIYPEVTVYYGEIGEYDAYTPLKTTGKTVYKYDIYDVYGYETKDTVFFEALKSYGNTLSYEAKSYRYNNLKEKTDYRMYGEYYQLAIKEINEWISSYYRVGSYIYKNPYPMPHYPLNITVRSFFDGKYDHYGISLLSSRNTTTFDDASGSVTLYESYSYNDKFLLKQKSVTNSNGQIVADEYFYPEIKTSGTPSPDIITKMVNKNMLTPIINKVTSTRNSPTASWKSISGYKIDYKEFNPENTLVIMPEKMSELEDNVYVLKTQVLSYTKHGNPQETVTKDNINTVYLWGYNYQYPKQR